MASRAEYLKRYLGGGGDAGGPERKRRRKRDAPSGAAGVRILDQDVNDWRHARPGERQAQEREEEEAPVVANAGEGDVRALPSRNDGSGWVQLPPASAAGDVDLSPPRRGRRESSSAEEPSPPRRRVRHDSDDEDLSPPRRAPAPPVAAAAAATAAPDLSPPRRRVRHDSDSDLSPPRRAPAAAAAAAATAAADLSPPRRGATAAPAPDLSPPRRPRCAPGGGGGGGGGGAVMTDGTRAGLLSGADVVAEAVAKRAAEAARCAAMGSEESGKGAGTVFRDRAGRAVSLDELQRLRQQDKRPEPERPAWGAGLAQARQAADTAAAVRAEASKPFARYADDAALNEASKRQQRWGDPLAGVLAPKQPEEPPMPPPPGGDAALLEKAGFRIPPQVPPHSWLRRKLGAPPNRYSIQPGRHWDGVDRGTGFEQQFFKARAERESQQQEGFLWAQSQYE